VGKNIKEPNQTAELNQTKLLPTLLELN